MIFLKRICMCLITILLHAGNAEAVLPATAVLTAGNVRKNNLPPAGSCTAKRQVFFILLNIWKHNANLIAAKVWEDDYADKIKNAQKGFSDSVPLYYTDICGILVSRDYIWDLYERFGLQFLVSHADEHYNICRLY